MGGAVPAKARPPSRVRQDAIRYLLCCAGGISYRRRHVGKSAGRARATSYQSRERVCVRGRRGAPYAGSRFGPPMQRGEAEHLETDLILSTAVCVTTGGR